MAKRKVISERGLTIRQLLTNVVPYVKRTGQDVYRTQIRRLRTKDGTVYKCQTMTRVLGEKPRKHDQEIRIVQGGTKASDPLTTLSVSCDCEGFCFVWEYALHRHGASPIKYSNGQPPHVTNGSLHPGICKHLYVILTNIFKGHQ